MSAVATKKRSADAAPAAATKAPVAIPTPEIEHPRAWLTFDLRDSMLRSLYSSGAAVQMLCMVFANEPQIEEGKPGIAGLMGVLQYVRRGLDALHIDITNAGADLDDLYWAVYGAQSLVALLEELEWADGWRWTLSDEFVGDYLTAAGDCIKQAIAYLEAVEVPHA
ncbi:hypothetical protein [Variovorax paradoxus]|uniref:hypothetical protein n=1 Tax=Variovorax paradoxus TaxID=34073 RepID=UPI001ABCD30B